MGIHPSRVAIVGYGAVAAIHARKLRAGGITLSAVCGPDPVKADAFALRHGCERADTRLDSALHHTDTVVIASPSPMHYEQGLEALERGVPALIELPACGSRDEATRLAEAADETGIALQCAHTSRYLDPFRNLGKWIRNGRLGEIRHVNYIRVIPPRSRSWTDDSLLHHAAHPLDLLLDWFGSLTPLGCVVSPGNGPPQDLALLARIPGNGPCTIAISYTGRLPTTRMTIVGKDHTVATDGFSFVESDDAELAWQGDGQATYEQAISEQDFAFLRCCEIGSGGIEWRETLRLTEYIEKFKAIWKTSE